MLKPIDIHNVDFKRGFKGYNEEEVDAFLAKIVGKYETIYQENQQLRDEVKSLQESLQKHASREQDIYDLITLTKETVTEAKALSREQANAVVEEAKRQAHQIVAEARLSVEQAERRVSELKRQEQAFKEKMRNLMETFWGMLVEPGDKAAARVDITTTQTYREIASGGEESY